MLRMVMVIALICPVTVFAGFTELPCFGTLSTESIAWGDMDNDGDLDLAQANSKGEENYFYINQGGATFDFRDFELDGYTSYGTAWGDYDNDCDLDIFTSCQGPGLNNLLYINYGDGTFDVRGALNTQRACAFAWGDIDGDGDLDVAVSNINGVYIFSNVNGMFQKTADYPYGHTNAIAFGDCEGDGDLDLALGTSGDGSSVNSLLVNNGEGIFVGHEEFGSGKTNSMAWGDYDNDGDLDMALGKTGADVIYTNMGDRVFWREYHIDLGSRDTYSLAWGDYDNDGDLDLVEGAPESPTVIYVNEGEKVFTEAEFLGTGETDTRSIAWGDADNDGDLDLAVGNNGTQSYLYLNDENDGDYLSVHLVGRFNGRGEGYSNSDGIGAKVSVFEKGHLGDEREYLLGFREIEANGGYCGQDSVEAEFGLPNDDTVEIRIVWPGTNGHHLTQDLIADKGQFITVHESEFHLLSPADDEEMPGFPVELDWEDVFSGGVDPYDAELAGYTVQIADCADFSNVVYTLNVTDSSATLDEADSGLKNGTYYWRVVANYAETPGNYGQYSPETWSFTLTEVGIAVQYFEASSERNGIALSWDANATEKTEIAGFNLYRSTGSGKAIKSREKLNAELITGESPYTYLDAAVEEGETYDYWLEAVDVGGAAETFGPAECAWRGALPTTYALYQSRPNPAKGSATIAFDLPEDAEVTLTVYDINGRKIATVVNETLPAGEHETEVSSLAPGVYVYRMEAGEFSAARKMVIIE
jgi:hypothetical protein